MAGDVLYSVPPDMSLEGLNKFFPSNATNEGVSSNK